MPISCSPSRWATRVRPPPCHLLCARLAAYLLKTTGGAPFPPGAFTLFRDLFVKTVTGVDPATPGLYQQASWQVANGSAAGDGVTITTLGQRVIPETLAAYKNGSEVSNPADATLSAGYTPFAVQPKGRFYAM